MAEYSGLFNSLDQNAPDRVYGADEFARFFSIMAKNGLREFLANQGAYNFTAGTGLQFTIGQGMAVYDGYFHLNDSPKAFALTPTSGGNNRIDFLVLSVDKTTAQRKVELRLIQGTAAPSPREPSLRDTGSRVDYPLYRFYVPSGATVISSVTRTDLRSYSKDSQAYGFMNPNVPAPDINALYEQGTYYVENPALLPNFPSTQNCLLEVFRDQSGKTFQRVTEINTGSTARNTILQRASTTGGTWQGWTATYSDRQIIFPFAFTSGVSGSGTNNYAIIGDRVRIEAVATFPSGLASGATIATLTASARPSTLTYLPPILANNGQRVSIAIQPSGDIQCVTAITSNTLVSMFGDFLLKPIR